jgi:hypothetical protein
MLMLNTTTSPCYLRVGLRREGVAWKRKRTPGFRVTLPPRRAVDLGHATGLDDDTLAALLGDDPAVRDAVRAGRLRWGPSLEAAVLPKPPLNPMPPPAPYPAPITPVEEEMRERAELDGGLPTLAEDAAVASPTPLEDAWAEADAAAAEAAAGDSPDTFRDDWSISELLRWAEAHGVEVPAFARKSRPKLLRLLATATPGSSAGSEATDSLDENE